MNLSALLGVRLENRENEILLLHRHHSVAVQALLGGKITQLRNRHLRQFVDAQFSNCVILLLFVGFFVLTIILAGAFTFIRLALVDSLILDQFIGRWNVLILINHRIGCRVFDRFCSGGLFLLVILVVVLDEFDANLFLSWTLLLRGSLRTAVRFRICHLILTFNILIIYILCVIFFKIE